MSDPTDESRARIAAAVRIESELSRALSCFAFEHRTLICQACGVPEGVTDLDAIVVTTMFGHTLDKMRKIHGSDHTRTLTLSLLEQLDRANRQFSEAAREGDPDPPPPRERMN